jgi:hypothetical protein
MAYWLLAKAQILRKKAKRAAKGQEIYRKSAGNLQVARGRENGSRTT